MILLHSLRRNCFFPDMSYSFREVCGWCQVGKCKNWKWALATAEKTHTISYTQQYHTHRKPNFAFQHNYQLTCALESSPLTDRGRIHIKAIFFKEEWSCVSDLSHWMMRFLLLILNCVNCNSCVWSDCFHAFSRWHLHSCYCTVTSLSLLGPFNLAKWD